MIPKKVQEKPEPKLSGRMAAEDRRQQILDVALQLFSQRGFRGTTTKEIALAAGVNEAIIFRHFATKSELYAAIMDRKSSSAEVQALQNSLKEAVASNDDRKVFESLAYHMLEAHARDDTINRPNEHHQVGIAGEGKAMNQPSFAQASKQNSQPKTWRIYLLLASVLLSMLAAACSKRAEGSSEPATALAAGKAETAAPV